MIEDTLLFASGWKCHIKAENSFLLTNLFSICDYNLSSFWLYINYCFVSSFNLILWHRSASNCHLHTFIFIAHLNHSLPGFLRTQILPSTLQSLTSYGLPDEIVQILNEWKNPDLAENVLVIAFLEALMLSAVGVGFERGMKRLIMSTSKKTPGAVELAQRMLSAFGAITQSSWGDFHGNLLQSA